MARELAEWHFLIVTAYLVIGFAAQREWREERFRDLYLSSTRERRQEVSVLFSVGVNSGDALVHEIGGAGHVAYPLVGDTINTGARLEGLAPVGGVLIGAETYERLPDGAVEPRSGLRVKGKDEAVDAYVLHALAC